MNAWERWLHEGRKREALKELEAAWARWNATLPVHATRTDTARRLDEWKNLKAAHGRYVELEPGKAL